MLGALIEQKTPSWIHYWLNSHLQDAISPQILDSQKKHRERSSAKNTLHMEFGRRKEGGKGVGIYDTVLNIAVSNFEGGTT